MAKLAAIVLLSCAVLFAQGARDDAQQWQMSSIFRKEANERMNLNQDDSWSQSRSEDSQDPDWTTEPYITYPYRTEPETEDSNSWSKPSSESSRQDQEHHSSLRHASRRTQQSRRDDDSWDQQTTTEYSWNEPETEESSSWTEPSSKSIKQDYRKHRINPFRRDSRRHLPSRGSSSWDQYTTTEDSWTQPDTEESYSWNEQAKQSDYWPPKQESWQHELPTSQDSWMNVPHFSNEMSPEAQNPWDDDSWTDPPSDPTPYSTEESESATEEYHSSLRHASRRTQQSRQDDDSWDQQTTTEYSWNEPETEESNSWTEPSSKSIKQDYILSSRKPASCYQRPERGSCQARKTRYYYDTETQSCSVFVWSGCEGNQNRFKTREMCESTCGGRSTSIPSGFKCRRDGYYKHPTTCEKFIQCANGIAYEQACPSGLHFSLSSTTCEAPCDAFCDPSLSDECGWDSTVPDDMDHLEVKQSYSCSSDGLFPDPDSCQSYIKCENDAPRFIRCPNNLHFNRRTEQCEPPCSARCDRSLACQCNWAECNSKEFDCNASPDQGPCDALEPRYYYDRDSSQCRQFYYGGCRGNGNNFRTQEECQRSCERETLKITEPFYCPRPNGRFADMYDCTTYFQCQDGESQIKRCPRGQWFDYKRRTCTSDDSAACMYKCRQPEGMYSYLPNCQKYVKCYQGKPTVTRCPSGQAFHKFKGRCMPQSEVNCGTGPFDKIELTDSKDFRCPTPSGKYPKVDDCAKYWQCAHGIANEADCGNKFFNPETLECDEQRNVSCPAYEIGKKVICYFDNDSPSQEKIVPEDLSPYLCTHIHYSSAMLEQSGDSYTISPTKRENDIILRYYQRVVDLKKLNQKLKVLLTLGGWRDSESSKYSQLVSNVDKWPTFIQAVIQYLRLYNFDGLEFDWEFPVCRTKDCNGKPPLAAEKEQFQSFLEMLYSRLSAEKLLLSVRVSGQKPVFENAYKMEELGKVTDYIVVMAYLPPGESQFDTAPPSILNPGRIPQHKYEDATSIMALWKHKVQDSNKLILGVRGDARVYQLSDTTKTDIYSPIPPHGIAPQDMPFRTVCSHLQSHDWRKGSSSQVADFIFQDVTWIGYQSPENMRKFAEHVMRHSYGGVAFISNLSDDFKGRCCHVKNPLLKGLTVGFSRRGMTPSDFGCP